MHSAEQHRKKEEARREALHHMHHSAVDGKHDDMQRHEMMYMHEKHKMMNPERMK